MNKKQVTLKDVARLAGVSTATVTRVLRNESLVTEKTRKRVEQAIQQTGYRINIVAQGLRARQTKTIGHILQGTAPNPFFIGVALGAEQEALYHGWSILAFNVQHDPERERLGIETFIQRRVDAILFTTPLCEENVRIALEAGLMVIQVERPTTLSTPTVTADNYAGTVEAIEHLIALGHRRIAYLGEIPPGPAERKAQPHQNRIEHERFSGYCDTLAHHQIPLDTELIVLDRFYTSADNGLLAGYHAMQKLLRSGKRPDAVFATSDIIAAGVLQALYAAHLSIPEDISVVGFDNTYSPYLSPPLTTVEQPMEQMGRAAVQMVIHHFQQHQQEEPTHIRLTTRLVVRGSTGPRKRLS
uniref:LacI family transcriptional regulator n=1 Tax=Thermosporothrix sp. COM3 TaxID=2490863 RepID=A0A455SM73_9CHLR|nr:LacI family transcriptional regulator [Thermosporothrix sp. COM3]